MAVAIITVGSAEGARGQNLNGHQLTHQPNTYVRVLGALAPKC
ncbi:hypothetical protein JCM19538_2634 [Jejuia pallidilutea]|uniref:Uncharacterized protein n=1 Tax=Jejuia pallidilutea TaxID=504487 RepID=A0A098LMU1_9FLAO|nr:hypothetical protein JCM19538_2634 [Jejuia pallidilutea]